MGDFMLEDLSRKARDGVYEAGQESNPETQMAVLAAALSTLTDPCVEGGSRSMEMAATMIGTAAGWAPRVAATIAMLSDPGPGAVDVRPMAAVCAAIGLRRLGDRDDALAATERLRQLSPPWPFVESMIHHLQSVAWSDSTPDGIDRSIRLGELALQADPLQPGILHALAGSRLDRAIWQPGRHEDDLDVALDYVERALALEDYPKFHFTRARILARKADDAQGRANALTALDQARQTEVRKAMDAQERRARYETEKLLMEVRYHVKESVQTAEERLDENVTALNAELTATSEALKTQLQETSLRLEDETRQSIQEESRRTLVAMIGFVSLITSVIALLQFAAALYITADRAADTDAGSMWFLIIAMVVTALVMWTGIGIGAWLISRIFVNKRSSAPVDRPPAT